MSWENEIAQIIQEKHEDKVRLYYDGAICVPSFTHSGQQGWLQEAPKIPGAPLVTKEAFAGQKYVCCLSMRQAISLRDRIVAAAINRPKTPRASQAPVPSHDLL